MKILVRTPSGPIDINILTCYSDYMDATPKHTTKPKAKKPRARAKNCSMDELKKKVESASFSLFLDNGYENTTMRMISNETGFGAGSLYNAYSGKDDIIQAIVFSAHDSILDTVKEFFKSQNNFLLAISLPMCIEIYASSINRKYAELMLVVHRNWAIFNRMIDKTLEWEYEYLVKLSNVSDRKELRDRLMINLAIVGRYVFEYSEEGPKDCKEGMVACLSAFNMLFNAGEKDIEKLVDDITCVLKEQESMGFFDLKSQAV